MKTKTKLWIAIPIGLVLLVGALGGVKAAQIGAMIQAGATFAPPPESVSSVEVQATEWISTRTAIGTLVPARGVTLGAEIPGLVREIAFESGAAVKKGAVLVRLDTTAEQAQLEAAEADAALAAVNLERAQSLRKAESNAPADLDAAEARAKAAAAAVANLRAMIAKKTIRAPFDGRMSIRQVELGQVLAAGTPIATLQSVTPIHADFWLPQQALADLQLGQAVRLRTDTFPNDTWKGEITAINPGVDEATRNVKIRATFQNPDGRLRAGMFANVEVLSNEKRKVVVIPVTSVLFAPYGDTVFLIESKKDQGGKDQLTVRQQFVRLGERRGDFVAVASGLEPGQRVVASGGFKLRNGMNVAVNNALAPKAQLAPTPSER
ncbi:MAG TPA: efflux RND transporter periplasmic adaptor subunit [Gemmatimonadaceae bacterium]|nr:efflux RND transporter periplasmic adaptor subunit [Gemmatimonadaceae bacterium]